MADKKAYSDGRIIKFVDPATLVLIGRDEGDETSEGWDPRVQWAIQDWMVESVGTYGVIEPIVVKPMEDGRLKVLDGRQRTINARAWNAKAGPKSAIAVPCIVSMGDDIEIGNVANRHRTPDGPMIAAWKMKEAKDRRARTIDQIATEFHVSTVTVKNKLALMKLSVKCMRAVDSRKISETMGKKLAALPCDEQDAALEALLASVAPGKKVKGKKADKEADEAVGGRGKKRQTQARVLKRDVIESELARLNKPGAQDSIDRPQPSTMAEGMRAALGWVLGRKVDKAYGMGAENVSKGKKANVKKSSKKATPKKPVKTKKKEPKASETKAFQSTQRMFRDAVNGVDPKADPRPKKAKKKRVLVAEKAAKLQRAVAAVRKAGSVVDTGKPDPLQDDGMVEDVNEDGDIPGTGEP